MASWGDKVEKGMDTVIPESRVTLDTGLFGKNIIILTFKVAHNFTETIIMLILETWLMRCRSTYLASLSIWSPKPGVSTMVNDIRVPSSSSSVAYDQQLAPVPEHPS